MKSSTLHRSNLSKERMVLLEELRAKSNTITEDTAPKTYVRPSKEKELDVLWQNFKVNQKTEKSPGIYLATGFITGALCMFLMTALLSFSTNSLSNSASVDDQPKLVKRVKNQDAAKLAIIPADKAEPAAPAAPETYTIKAGDTLEGVIIRFYGKYDTSKVSKIMEANNMSNPNQLSIGQKLIIPMD